MNIIDSKVIPKKHFQAPALARLLADFKFVSSGYDFSDKVSNYNIELYYQGNKSFLIECELNINSFTIENLMCRILIFLKNKNRIG